MTKRSIGTILLLAMAAAACGSGGSTSLATDAVPTSTPSVSTPPPEPVGGPPEPILGTWRMQYTCEKSVQAFDHAGIGKLASQELVGMRIQQDQLASSSHPCDGANKVERTVIFRPNGYLIRYQGDKVVDDCRCYQLIAGHTFVVPGEGNAPDIALRYRIDGDTLTFDAHMPDLCSTTRCRHQFAFAVAQYAVGAWRRVDQ